jgi:hypothetical protein
MRIEEVYKDKNVRQKNIYDAKRNDIGNKSSDDIATESAASGRKLGNRVIEKQTAAAADLKKAQALVDSGKDPCIGIQRYITIINSSKIRYKELSTKKTAENFKEKFSEDLDKLCNGEISEPELAQILQTSCYNLTLPALFVVLREAMADGKYEKISDIAKVLISMRIEEVYENRKTRQKNSSAQGAEKVSDPIVIIDVTTKSTTSDRKLSNHVIPIEKQIAAAADLKKAQALVDSGKDPGISMKKYKDRITNSEIRCKNHANKRVAENFKERFSIDLSKLCNGEISELQLAQILRTRCHEATLTPLFVVLREAMADGRYEKISDIAKTLFAMRIEEMYKLINANGNNRYAAKRDGIGNKSSDDVAIKATRVKNKRKHENDSCSNESAATGAKKPYALPQQSEVHESVESPSVQSTKKTSSRKIIIKVSTKSSDEKMANKGDLNRAIRNGSDSKLNDNIDMGTQIAKNKRNREGDGDSDENAAGGTKKPRADENDEEDK